jgi:hypothetical protein
MSAVEQRRGFRLVEAVIVAVVIAVILAVTIPWLRERERARLQALADAAPWEVFELRATPTKETFAEGEDILVWCEIVNPTRYPLTLPNDLYTFYLAFGNPISFAINNKRGQADPMGTATAPMDLMGHALAPRESVGFEVMFFPIGTRVDRAGPYNRAVSKAASKAAMKAAKEEVRVVYWSGVSMLTLGLVEIENREKVLGAFFLGDEGVIHRGAKKKRFQSNAFQLLFEPTDDSASQTPARVAEPQKPLNSTEMTLETVMGVSFVDRVHLIDFCDYLIEAYDISIVIDSRVVRPPNGPVDAADNPNATPVGIPEYVTDGFGPYINFKDMTMRNILKAVLKPLNLDYSVQRDFVWISSPEKIRDETFEDME